MKAKENKYYDVTAELDSVFGPVDSESRKRAEDLAWEEYNCQILLDARKSAGLTQQEVAEKIGVNKGYISRLERGLTVPTISTFYRIVSAMGFSVVLKPAYQE